MFGGIEIPSDIGSIFAKTVSSIMLKIRVFKPFSLKNVNCTACIGDINLITQNPLTEFAEGVEVKGPEALILTGGFIVNQHNVLA